MLPENETIQFEDRTYVNPEASLQEQNAFIDNLRNVQNQNNAEIATDTYNLGTAIPSNLGGLGGGESYFTSRYQVPQGVALANNLRATAQAQALNDILSNEQAMMKQRYTNAQRAARQRAAARAAAAQYPQTYSGGEDTGFSPTDQKLGSVEPQFSPAGSGDFVFTPSTIGSGGSLGGGGALSPKNTVTPAGPVNIVRNQGGGIESLSYNGKTYTGDAAKKRFDFLTQNGSISRAGE